MKPLCVYAQQDAENVHQHKKVEVQAKAEIKRASSSLNLDLDLSLLNLLGFLRLIGRPPEVPGCSSAVGLPAFPVS